VDWEIRKYIQIKFRGNLQIPIDPCKEFSRHFKQKIFTQFSKEKLLERILTFLNFLFNSALQDFEKLS
jgi:hypothetical protein